MEIQEVTRSRRTKRSKIPEATTTSGGVGTKTQPTLGDSLTMHNLSQHPYRLEGIPLIWKPFLFKPLLKKFCQLQWLALSGFVCPKSLKSWSPNQVRKFIEIGCSIRSQLHHILKRLTSLQHAKSVCDRRGRASCKRGQQFEGHCLAILNYLTIRNSAEHRYDAGASCTQVRNGKTSTGCP